MSKSEIHRERVQSGERPSQDVPEFHGNPNDLYFNHEFVFNLKKQLQQANNTIEAMHTSLATGRELKAAQDLLKLIHKDLKMRADEDMVVNISNFIWENLVESVKK